jgi:protocatechuate 3,4-dioxygenase beta subunit
MKPINRRHALKATLVGAAASILRPENALAKSAATPSDAEGPFYPVEQQKDKDFDLTQVEGHTDKAKGQVITITGRVLDTDGNPIENVMVELWQANAVGRYAHPRDTSKTEIDPHFQGWAIVPSGKEGKFDFKTIKPGAYQAGKNWVRPPHIHFKASKFGFQPVTTQMYFPEDAKLNEADGLLKRKSKLEQGMMIAKLIKEDGLRNQYQYNLILAKAGNKPAPQQE